MSKPSQSFVTRSQMEHNTKLDCFIEHKDYAESHIICTIGPKTQNVEMLKELMQAGMSVVRLNFSHGTHEYHSETIANARQAAKDLGYEHVAIALDTKGPEIRSGFFRNPDGAKMVKGNKVVVTTDDKYKEDCTESLLYVDYANITKVVSPGGTIYVDDGILALRVDEIVDAKTINCTATSTHQLTSKRGINLPGADVDLPAVSEKDRSDLLFGVEQGVDMVFASFIRSADQVREVRSVLGEKGKNIQVIAKIENHQGVRDIDEILEEVDGIMVARGDLGVEIPAAKVMVAQKMLISKCNALGKPVICATQMLESMTTNPRPTRAEVSDVANAVLDGADCVMLSGETAKGAYPVETVEYMKRICIEAQHARRGASFFEAIRDLQPIPLPVEESICASAVFNTFEVDAKAIIVLSNTGRSAKLVAKYQPRCPVVCVSQQRYVCRGLSVVRNVNSVYYNTDSLGPDVDRERRVKLGMKYAVEVLKCVQPGEYVFAVHADVHHTGYANSVRVLQVPTDLTI